METVNADNQASPAVVSAGQDSTTDVVKTDVSAPVDTNKTPQTVSTPTGQTDIDYRKNYEELRKFATQTSQERSELKKQLEAMQLSQKQIAEMLAKSTEAPYNPDEFMENLRSQGPKFLQNHFDKWRTGIDEKYDKEISQVKQDNLNLQASLAIALRRGDEMSFPDFEKLEGKMGEIASSDNCPVDLSKPINEVLDALYKLARDSHSADAVKVAEQIGAKKAEEQIAKEAATAVATGGKNHGITPVNPSKEMSLEQMRKFFVDKLGEQEYNSR